MKLWVFTFTQLGKELAEILQSQWQQKPVQWQLIDGRSCSGGLSYWTGEGFRQADGLIFIGAAGIAVRSIAPYLQAKTSDPAVVVLDEQGQYAVSLLSGHLGGGNALTKEIAHCLSAHPVITTATDGRGLVAIDQWAREQSCLVRQPQEIKYLSAALLAGNATGVASDFPVLQLANGYGKAVTGEHGVYLGYRGKKPFTHTVQLLPRQLVLGLGCRQGVGSAVLEQVISSVLQRCCLPWAVLTCVATISLKEQEPGILQLCSQYGLPLEAYSPDALQAQPYREQDLLLDGSLQGQYSSSAFVQSVTGVDNVCERAALAASQGGWLVSSKYAARGVTVALAVRPWMVEMREDD